MLLYDLRPVRAGQPLALYTPSGAAASNAACEQQTDAALTGAMNTLNAQYGRGTVRLASSRVGEAQMGTTPAGESLA